MLLLVKKILKALVKFIYVLVERYPIAVALFGFVSGVLSFMMVERKEALAQIIAALMLLSWIWLSSEVLLKKKVTHWFDFELPPAVINLATQMVHQESLFFVIPFFFITTAWNSGHMVFTTFLMVAALVSVVDPIYHGWLAPRRGLYFIFHGITLFAVLLSTLPIIFHLPTPNAYLWSLLIAMVLTLANVTLVLKTVWWKRIFTILLLVITTTAMGLLIRPWIPPATLWLTEVAITDQFNPEDRSPQNTFKLVNTEQLQHGLYAYTAIHAPRGLNERIYHIWQLNGQVIDKVALDINGGRAEGYRSWSHKENFPEHPIGHWKIQVVTEANQLIGILRFDVVESKVEVTPTPVETIDTPIIAVPSD